MQKADLSNLDLEEIIGEVEELITPVYRGLDRISLCNHSKVLRAFHKARVSEFHLKGSTGYGYGDAGRDAVESVFASIFGSEAALVRGQIVSGTHAITLCLFGILRPGDEVLSVSGAPMTPSRRCWASGQMLPVTLPNGGLNTGKLTSTLTGAGQGRDNFCNQ